MMSGAAKSILVFGMYLVAVGVTLLLIPSVPLVLFGLPTAGEVWIRILGMLLLFYAFYYIQAARKELTEFFRWTVYTRSSALVFLAAFVGLGLIKPILFIFVVPDLLGALWTGLALRSSTIPQHKHGSGDMSHVDSS